MAWKWPYFVGAAMLTSLTLSCGKGAPDSQPAQVPANTSEDTVAPPSASAEDSVEKGVGPANVASPQTAAPASPKAAAPPAQTIAAPTADQIKLWTPAPFAPVQLLGIREWEKTSFTSCVAATADGRHFIVAGSRVLLWSLEGDEPEHVFLELTPEDGERSIHSLAVAPDGKWFAVGDSTGKVRIWSLEDRSEIVAKELGTNSIEGLAISPDGQEIATISYDNKINVWSADQLEPRHEFEVDTNSVNHIEYVAPNVLAAAGESTSLWDPSTGKLVQAFSAGRYSHALARSPDGAQFILGGDDSLHFFNAADVKPSFEITQGVSGSERIAYSPDGKFMATTNGGSVQIWNLAERRVTQVIDSFGWAIVGVGWLPSTNLLVVASESGCTRVWGTPSQGAAVALKPLHQPVALPDKASKAPATQAQMEQVIDLRTFPRLPGNESNFISAGDFGGLAAVKPDEAKTFYKYFLEQAGWTLTEVSALNPAAMEFGKGGCRLSVSCYDSGDGKTNIMAHLDGNYDMRWTPRFDAAPIETAYESAGSLSYRTKADLLQIETTLLRKMKEAGWIGYTRLKSSHGETPDERDMTFLRNGTTLRVSIGKFPVDPDSYTIQYSLFPNNSSVPPPPDAGYIEFDGSTDPTLVATTALTLDQAQKFYDEALVADGWLIREQGRSKKDDHAWLTYLRGQSNLTVGLTKLPNGNTLVQVGEATGSLWELSQAEEEPIEEGDDVGLEAADIPTVEGAQPPKFDVDSKQIEIQIPGATLADTAERFTQALAPLGWKPEAGGIRDEEYTLITYKMDDKELNLRARKQQGNAVVGLEGDGLLWTKELPTAKQTISYETWLRRNKLPASLEFLDRYETEMRGFIAP
ncbi:MAG: hypothetical protein SGJ19_23080 [Planctomycetia bacterium]|nr:hypothetical protein [Planctomycetia bacterium]